ncbi:MAG TPA: hypothetical protein PKY23_07550 [Bacillota bacterium]|nr:hypothetical protein [Bacillota bacterium]
MNPRGLGDDLVFLPDRQGPYVTEGPPRRERGASREDGPADLRDRERRGFRPCGRVGAARSAGPILS